VDRIKPSPWRERLAAVRERIRGWLLQVWARSVYTSAGYLFGSDHQRTSRAAESLALELVYCQDYDAALVVRQTLLDTYTRAGREADAIRVRLDLGCTLHAASRCDDGVDTARQAWQDWERLYGVDTSGVGKLITVAALLRACNRHAEAIPLLDQARSWVRIAVRDLAPRQRTTAVVLLLTRQPLDLADHHQVCARRSAAPATGGERTNPARCRIVVDDLL
jgi:hypothetical protein